ncbi:recombinase family protein [Neobacillus niacini]|uniref:recombinase family protein n=1 Tax=Neobacillus niacini TaxID=86668 RepID=UPI0005ED5A1A|nr:recombinase family protein [Neobacillus niacini]
MRCAIYTRVSTDKEEQKASLSNQKELFFNYISSKGWSFYDIYVDVESGTSDKRPGLQKLIEDAENRKFDVILAKELSRLARNGGLSYKIRDLADRNGIHIITLDNAINSFEGNSAMFGLYAWIYEQESQRTGERIKAALQTRSRKGLFQGSIPPYGYELSDGKLFLRNDDTPSIVCRIFKEYLQGKGFDRIARGLYNGGYPTPAQIAGKATGSDKWHGSTIRTILTNPHYTGDLVQGRQTTRSVTSKVRENLTSDQFIVIEGTHEPIISKEDFNAVQALIETRKRKKPYAEIHLFTNTLRCADCGRGMHYKKNRRGYVCGSYNKHGSKACSDHHVIEDNLVSSILSDIEIILADVKEKNLFTKLEKKMNKEFEKLNKQLSAINRQIDDIGIQKTKLIQLLANEVISQQDYRDVIKQNELHLKHLIQTKSEIEIKLSNKNVTEQIKKIQKDLSKIKKVDTLTPDLLHRLIERIEIKADGTARIFYRFSLPSAII